MECMKNVVKLFVSSILILCLIVNASTQNSELQYSLNDSSKVHEFLNIKSVGNVDAQLLFFYNDDGHLKYYVGIFGEILPVKENHQGFIVSFMSQDDRPGGIILQYDDESCEAISLRNAGFTSDCANIFHPNGGYAVNQLELFKIKIQDVPEEIEAAETYLENAMMKHLMENYPEEFMNEDDLPKEMIYDSNEE